MSRIAKLRKISRRTPSKIFQTINQKKYKASNGLEFCGISDDEMTHRFHEAVRIENDKKTVKGLPIAMYNDDLKKAYLQYPDGRVEYV